MATLPLSGTNVRLLSGVPFSADYKHSRWFDTLSQQTSYFLGKPTTYRDEGTANFQRIDGRYYIKVHKHIDSLWGTNYLMFQNASYNNKWFYGFVTKLEYINTGVTHVHFQIDVFQTWRFEMNFKPSFVVREHRPLWASDGRPIINTIDEGLDYGTEYENVDVHHYTPLGGYKWLVIVCKTPIDSNGDNKVSPTVIGTPQPLTYYVTPFKDDNTTPKVLISKTGEDVPITDPRQLMEQIYSDEKAVNNVVSLFITEHPGFAASYSPGQQGGFDIITLPDNGNEFESALIATNIVTLKIKKIARFSEIEYTVSDDKYSGFEKPTESKLLMYPYCVTVLDDFKGNRVEFKNEYINRASLLLTVKGSLGLSNKVSYGIKDYNYGASSDRGAISNESALINNTPSDVPIINDYLAAFLQGNRNSINNQKDSIVFNGLMNSIGSAVSGVASAATGNALGAASSGMSLVQGAGNTVLQLQGIEAKQKDIANVPPQITKMGSNTSYDYGNGYNGVYVIKKQIKPEYRRKLTDFFNMYGYKTNEVKVPNFHTRKYWNYVQTLSCVITGNFNNEDLNELKSIFDNGITLWHTDDIGNYSLNNEVI